MSDAAWFYAESNQQQGPVGWEALRELAREGQLRRSQFVWSAGMATWLPGGQVEGLFEGCPPDLPAVAVATPVAVAYGMPAPWSAQDNADRKARINCIALFVLFAFSGLTMIGSAVSLTTSTRPSRWGGDRMVMNFAGILASVGAVFAAIYVPVAWAAIRRISAAYRRLGLVGAFGVWGCALAYAMYLFAQFKP